MNVIYSKFTEGHFKSKRNGKRKYQVDFTNIKRTMGTYHFLDGARVRILYRGNDITCGRCHQTAMGCLGSGIAKNNVDNVYIVDTGDNVDYINNMDSVEQPRRKVKRQPKRQVNEAAEEASQRGSRRGS